MASFLSMVVLFSVVGASGVPPIFNYASAKSVCAAPGGSCVVVLAFANSTSLAAVQLICSQANLANLGTCVSSNHTAMSNSSTILSTEGVAVPLFSGRLMGKTLLLTLMLYRPISFAALLTFRQRYSSALDFIEYDTEVSLPINLPDSPFLIQVGGECEVICDMDKGDNTPAAYFWPLPASIFF